MDTNTRLVKVEGTDYYHLIVEDYLVPNIKVYEPESDGDYTMSLDDRFAVAIPRDRMLDLGWYIAQCMAVSAGYSSHGANARPLSVYARMAMPIVDVIG